MQDNVVRQALLGQQGELLAVFDLARRQLQKLLGRANGALHQPVGGFGSPVRRELIAQILEKRAPSALGKEPGSFGRCEFEEVVYIKVGRIVEVCDAAYQRYYLPFKEATKSAM